MQDLRDFNKFFFGTLGIVKDLAEGDYNKALGNASELYYERPAGTGTEAIPDEPEPKKQKTLPLVELQAPLRPAVVTTPPAGLQRPWDFHTTVIPVYDDGRDYTVGLQQPSTPVGINPTFGKVGFG